MIYDLFNKFKEQLSSGDTGNGTAIKDVLDYVVNECVGWSDASDLRFNTTGRADLMSALDASGILVGYLTDSRGFHITLGMVGSEYMAIYTLDKTPRCYGVDRFTQVTVH